MLRFSLAPHSQCSDRYSVHLFFLPFAIHSWHKEVACCISSAPIYQPYSSQQTLSTNTQAEKQTPLNMWSTLLFTFPNSAKLVIWPIMPSIPHWTLITLVISLGVTKILSTLYHYDMAWLEKQQTIQIWCQNERVFIKQGDRWKGREELGAKRLV